MNPRRGQSGGRRSQGVPSGLPSACLAHAQRLQAAASAFRATLEELEGADLLLHVVDISDPKREEKMTVVHDLLKELSLAEIPELIVYNKCDKLEAFEVTALCRKQNAIPVSATAKTGLKELIERINETLWQYESLTQPAPWELRESPETSEVP